MSEQVKKNTAKFQIDIDENGKVNIKIEGTNGELLRGLILAADDSQDILELFMDATLGAVAKHLKEHHGVDLIDIMRQKMEEQFDQDVQFNIKEKKERMIN